MNKIFLLTLITMKSQSLFYLIICFACMTSCTSKPAIDLAKEMETLSLLQQQEQKAHLEEQPALLVNMLNDTLTQVKNGTVSYYTKDQMTERFIKYFESVEFFKWEDIAPPVYTIAEDGSIAHILIRKKVIINDVTGPEPVRDTTLFAWTELWKKKEGRWKMYEVTTTER
jgi:hypothetical protein